MKNKLLYVGYSAENRTKASGYEHIIDFSHDDYDKSYMDAANLPFGFIPTGQRGKRINLYFLEIMSHLSASKYDIIHNFYCDNQLLFKYPSSRKYAAIATTHLNYHDFTKYQLNVLKSYDRVIVLNSMEENVLREKGIQAVFIPHGFDVPKFQENANILDNYSNTVNVCFSGVCYRDYETLRYFIENIKENKDIVLHILGQRREVKEQLRALNQNNVAVYDFLSDDDYYSVMSKCDYSFLPLTFATANNTLLEAQFMGIKSILPNMEGVSDYASMDYNLLYNSREELLNIIRNLKKEVPDEKLVNYAQKFKWSYIFDQTKIIYDDALKKYR